MKTSEILNLTADDLQVFGWRSDGRGWYPRPGEAACLEGGVRRRCEQAGADFGAVRAVVRAHLTQSFPDEVNPFAGEIIAWSWNDAMGREFEDVLAVLRACAVIEEARENAEVLEKVSA